ncbi:terpenoid synthase [Sistotremastrum niveocremeum HHB9708]|uniref:(2E,6E)-farnesyl diphosphate synthase n=2 Tax=Sistotremastraceae TaxID=3402574 RepID=A0A164NK89_9AGAM|nr:terpenoid synthase [Sistotremastrum niveocremeum HHB9708]KZT41925.1 putative farnesyltranstransferase [Sistotremastrum suecicum HHB10207 ss-3]
MSATNTPLYENLLEYLSEPSTWDARQEAALLEPYTYLTSNPGKEIRTKLIEAFNLWLEVPQEKLKIIGRVVSMLHTASLLMDDVEDDSQLRRGIPVAHKIYGIPQTINTANYVYFLAFKELLALRDSSPTALGSPPQDLDKLVTDELINLHRGQGLDLLWRDSLSCPTEQEYVDMVNNKTGGLFRIAIKLMMSQSTSRVNCIPLVNLIGVLFQIRDDYMNLQSDEYEENKGFCEDLTEGKFSFPIVHSIRADTTNRQVLNVLQKRPSTPTTKRYVVNYMREHTRSFEYTIGVLDTLEKQARAEIKNLGGNVLLEAIIDRLSITHA